MKTPPDSRGSTLSEGNPLSWSAPLLRPRLAISGSVPAALCGRTDRIRGDGGRRTAQWTDSD